MPTDIYTGQVIEKTSCEHILPNFLGGRLTSTDIIDEATNRRFGDTIDARLAEALQPIRVIVNGLAHRGGAPPPVLRNIEGADGNKYRLQAGGELYIVPKIDKREHEGRMVIDAKVPNKEALKIPLLKFAAREKLDAEEILAKIAAASIVPMAAPGIKFSSVIPHRDCYRASAKIACNLFAMHYADVFRLPSFDKIRNFVNGVDGPRRPPVEATGVMLSGSGIGPLDHLVVVKSDSDGVVTAWVVYYATIGFSVLLGRMGDVQPISLSYRVNQIPVLKVERAGRLNDSNDLKIEFGRHADLVLRSHDKATDDLLGALKSALASALAFQSMVREMRRFQDGLERALQAYDPDMPLSREALREVLNQALAELEPHVQSRVAPVFWRYFGFEGQG